MWVLFDANQRYWIHVESVSIPAGMGCPDENLLLLLGERRLGSDATAALEDHVDGCDCCRRLVARWLQARTADIRDDSEPAAGDAPEGTSSPLLAPATHVDRYIVLGLAGIGSMGVVYAAYDPE